MPKRPAFDSATAVAHLRASDPKLRALIDRVGICTLEPKRSDSLFASLLRSIVHQQLNGKAAATIHGRVLAELDRHGGPTAAALAKSPDVALRAAGLSANKLKALRDLADKCLAGSVPEMREVHALSDDELVERLTQVRGIGPWTVHMLLIFTLGRPDVMPTGDFAIRQAFKKLHGKRKDPTPEAILKHARCWQPYRSIASWYLWRSLDI